MSTKLLKQLEKAIEKESRGASKGTTGTRVVLPHKHFDPADGDTTVTELRRDAWRGAALKFSELEGREE